MQKKLYVGSYTGPCKGKGIYCCSLDTKTGTLNTLSVEENCENPNFIEVNWEKNLLCALNENNEGVWLSTYRILEDGTLYYLDRKDIPGCGPCHICMDQWARKVFYANYVSGDIGMILLKDTGHFAEEIYIIQHTGQSIHQRQDQPHPHGVHLSPDEKYLLVPDLGTDEIVVYEVQSTRIQKKSTKKVLPGEGPRHLVFHPNKKWMYLICEITNVVYFFDYLNDGELEERQRISLLTENMKNEYIAGEIAVSPNGKYLLAGTRSWGEVKNEQGFLTIFEIQETGLLRLRKVERSCGCHPRMFCISSDGRYVLMSNQYSGNIVSFQFDQENGEIRKCDVCSIAEATCVWCE